MSSLEKHPFELIQVIELRQIFVRKLRLFDLQIAQVCERPQHRFRMTIRGPISINGEFLQTMKTRNPFPKCFGFCWFHLDVRFSWPPMTNEGRFSRPLRYFHDIEKKVLAEPADLPVCERAF